MFDVNENIWKENSGMTEKEKKSYLGQYANIEAEIKSLEIDRNEINNEAERIKAMKYSDMPTAHKITDISDTIVRITDQQNKIDKLILELMTEKAIILDSTNSISDTHARLAVKYVYAIGHTIKRASELLICSERTVDRLLKKGISEYNVNIDVE